MKGRLKNVFKKHDEYLNSEERVYPTYIAPKSKQSPRIQMNPARVKNAIPGLLRVQCTFQKSLNQKTIKECFHLVGIDQENVMIIR